MEPNRTSGERSDDPALREGASFLTDEYMRCIKRLEALPENQDGADKTWVLEADRRFRLLFEQARRIR